MTGLVGQKEGLYYSLHSRQHEFSICATFPFLKSHSGNVEWPRWMLCMWSFSSQLKDIQLRKPKSFRMGCKQTCLTFIPQWGTLLYWTVSKGVLFSSGSHSVFPGCWLFSKHPWKLVQNQSCQFTRYAETQGTHGELSPDSCLKPLSLLNCTNSFCILYIRPLTDTCLQIFSPGLWCAFLLTVYFKGPSF